MEQYKLIAVAGEAGSGKDSLANALVDQLNDEGIQAHKVVAYTTRPPRDFETNGIDYYFTPDDLMVKLILQDKIIEAAEFNGWIYGTNIDDLKLDCINVEILSPEAIETVSQDDRINMFILGCKCSDKVRLIRQLLREDGPDVNEIIRRFGADKRDFSDFEMTHYSPNYGIIYTDSGLSISEEAAEAVNLVRSWAEEDK